MDNLLPVPVQTVHLLFMTNYSPGLLKYGHVQNTCNRHLTTSLMADLRFASSQWEMALHCNDISHWLGTNLESVLSILGWYLLCFVWVYSNICILILLDYVVITLNWSKISKWLVGLKFSGHRIYETSYLFKCFKMYSNLSKWIITA